ncbi:hypothetical protein OHC33_000393 [Knufia fluminis]|uniref:Uncharacterized protein n=1 Tax=Knufia fluminis TaxID=191047 RepID=A0AAN8ICH3_9EURO|nr:hypothetical protein OHC33_000393 [Knufia fluminis]
MKVSSWTVQPVYALSTSALVIPNTESASNAVAGSIAHPNTTEAADQTLSALQSEYERLDVLKHQLYALHHEVLKQERETFVLINKDFRSCAGVKCYLQTALRKAPDFFELLKTHFQHHPKNATASAWDCLWTGERPEAQESLLTTEADVVGEDGSLPPPPEDGPSYLDAGVPPPPLSQADEELVESDTYPAPSLSPSPSHSDDGPFDSNPPGFDHPQPGWHPDHHGSPPPPTPEYEPWKANPNSPAPHPQHPKISHPFQMPHPAPRHRHFKLILATTTFVVAFIILAGLAKALRVYLSNPRVQADRAARREECRTRREYKRAACHYQLRQFISRFYPRGNSGDTSTDDYEEKRAMLQQTDSVDTADHIMGADINSLRRAQDLVSQLVRAEEGRIHNYPRLQQEQPEEPVASSSRSIRSLRTTTTLPLYTPPPPQYSQELRRDVEVIDGFRYTPAQSDLTPTRCSSASSFILDDADLSTESSVIDCRSRLSMDTESVAPSHRRV